MRLTLPLLLCFAVGLPAAAQAPAPPSSLLRPGLDAVSSAIKTLKTDKWKRGSVRDEATQDIGSMVTDIQLHLPPLLSDADAAPTLVSKQVPVARNIDALYDVLLRVYDAARIAGPSEDVGALQQALGALSKARLSLYDRMTGDATAQEKLAADLRATAQKQAAALAAAPPLPPPCPTPAPKKKKTMKPSPSAPQKPAASTPTQKSGQ
ncbi:MAG: hypothetical protein P4L40_10095 [Terracidiphilus sp.]|nr:hypothetical protein [Terracidiphilus sp.]